eukprot:evm.model.scf_196.3 EVM.evm.TU.scf_196.3   scf_196:18765-30020(+)
MAAPTLRTRKRVDYSSATCPSPGWYRVKPTAEPAMAIVPEEGDRAARKRRGAKAGSEAKGKGPSPDERSAPRRSLRKRVPSMEQGGRGQEGDPVEVRRDDGAVRRSVEENGDGEAAVPRAKKRRSSHSSASGRSKRRSQKTLTPVEEADCESPKGVGLSRPALQDVSMNQSRGESKSGPSTKPASIAATMQQQSHNTEIEVAAELDARMSCEGNKSKRLAEMVDILNQHRNLCIDYSKLRQEKQIEPEETVERDREAYEYVKTSFMKLCDQLQQDVDHQAQLVKAATDAEADARSQLVKVQNEVADMRAKLNNAESELGFIRAEQQQWREEAAQLKTRTADLERELASAKAELSAGKEENDLLRAQAEKDLAESREGRIADVAVLQEQLDWAKEELAQCRNDVQVIEDQLKASRAECAVLEGRCQMDVDQTVEVCVVREDAARRGAVEVLPKPILGNVGDQTSPWHCSPPLAKPGAEQETATVSGGDGLCEARMVPTQPRIDNEWLSEVVPWTAPVRNRPFLRRQSVHEKALFGTAECPERVYKFGDVTPELSFQVNSPSPGAPAEEGATEQWPADGCSPRHGMQHTDNAGRGSSQTLQALHQPPQPSSPFASDLPSWLLGLKVKHQTAGGGLRFLHEASKYEFEVSPCKSTSPRLAEDQQPGEELEYRPVTLGEAEDLLPVGYKERFRFLKRHGHDFVDVAMTALASAAPKGRVHDAVHALEAAS